MTGKCTSPMVTMFSCRICKCAKKVESTCVAIKRHVKSDHGMFTCNNAHCIAGFWTMKARDLHSAVHMQKRQVCPKCAAVFSHRFALECHMILHQKHPRHACDLCDKVYYRVQDLKEHGQTTHSDQQFTCDQCAYVGKSRRSLKQHKLVHEPLKLSCTKCSAHFRWRSQLAAHKYE